MLRVELTRHAQAIFAMKLANRPAALRAEETEDAVQETLKRALSAQRHSIRRLDRPSLRGFTGS